MKTTKRQNARWEKTRVDSLYRHVGSGRFYGVLYVGGKKVWRTLKTDNFAVAKVKFNEIRLMSSRSRLAVSKVESGNATMGDLTNAYLAEVEEADELKPSSKSARRHAVARIRKTWPGFDTTAPRAVTVDAVQRWATQLKREGTGFVPPGAKSGTRGNSATSVNTSIDALRRILDLAVRKGCAETNVAAVKSRDRKNKLKKTPKKKLLDLPKLAEFTALFREIEKESGGASGAARGVEIADFCRGLAFSGCRRAELASIEWRHIDRTGNKMTVPGTKTEDALRIVPMNQEMIELLERVRARREARATETGPDGKPRVPDNDKVFAVSEAQKSISRACAKIGIKRLTHHDFRHVFATVCIESGVDIPTVAEWMGHADGGALALKTYKHLRDEHSQNMAAKVAWTPTG